MSVNKDKDIPRSEETLKADVTPSAFVPETALIHIFWGPDQLTVNYPGYSPPSIKNWKKQYLNIPKVCRFIYAVNEAYDTDNYPDPDGGGGGDDDCYFQIMSVVDTHPLWGRFVIYYQGFGGCGWADRNLSLFTVSTSDEFAHFAGAVGMKYVPQLTSSVTGALNYFPVNGAFTSRYNGLPVRII